MLNLKWVSSPLVHPSWNTNGAGLGQASDCGGLGDFGTYGYGKGEDYAVAGGCKGTAYVMNVRDGSEYTTGKGSGWESEGGPSSGVGSGCGTRGGDGLG